MGDTSEWNAKNGFYMPIEINYSETRGTNVDDFRNLGTNLSCFIPICIYSFMASRVFLQDYIPWVVSSCSKSKIIIGDYLERHNIMVFNSISEDEAICKAKKRGDKIRRIIDSILPTIESNNSVTVCSCRDEIETLGCKRIADNIQTFATNNPSFEADLNEQTQLMLNGTQRLSKPHHAEISTNSMTQLHNYMVEELALYIHLYNQGITTEIYPGRDMKILRKIASDQYEGFPYDFINRTHISVAVFLDSGASYAWLDNNNGEGKR